MVKNLPANAGDVDLIPGSGRSPGERNDYPLQYSCLGNPMDRGTWRATVHGVARVRHDLATKQQTQKQKIVCKEQREDLTPGPCSLPYHILLEKQDRC